MGQLVRIVAAGLTAAFAGAAPLLAQSAGDQPADSGGIADILVTASRTGETSLQSTPIAVSVLTGAELNDRGVRDVKDLKLFVPNLQVSDLAGYTQLYIRGVGSNIVFIGSDPSTTMHLDGIYLARPLSYLNDFLDVERIEVLRGPQGTLYGRNSVGGTINIISRKPSETLEGQVVAAYGTYNRYAVKGYVSGPIAGGIRASLSADVSGNDAFRENVSNGNDVEDQKSRGVRGQLLVPIGADGEWIIRADWSRQMGALGGYPKLLRPTGFPIDDAVLDDPGKVSMDIDNHSTFENYGATSDFSMGIADGLLLRSLTGYREFRGSILSDADSSAIDFLRTLIGPIRQSQFSQELSVVGNSEKVDWVVGLYYFQEKNREPLTLAILPFGVSRIQRPLLSAYSYAAFGQGEFRLNERLSLVAGLRLTVEQKRWSLADFFTASVDPDPAVAEGGFVLKGVPGLSDPFRVEAGQGDSALTPRLGLNFKPNDDILLYASATRGFKSGGYDYGASNAVDSAAGFGPEKLWSYEAGLKSDLLDRRLRFNLTGFIYDYADLQVQSYVQVGAVFGARTQNAATARVRGIEAEIVARPVRALELTANLSHLDARYRSYPNAFVTTFGDFDAAGKHLNNAPRWSGTVGAAYTLDLANSGEINFGADASFQSTVYFTAANDGVAGATGYAEQQGGYGVVNGRIGWASPDGRIRAQLIGTNLFDRNYIVGTANYGAAIAGRQGRPREVFGQLSYRF